MATVTRMNQCYAYCCDKDGFAQFNGNLYCFDHLRQCMNVNTDIKVDLTKYQQAQIDEEPNYKPCENCSA